MLELDSVVDVVEVLASVVVEEVELSDVVEADEVLEVDALAERKRNARIRRMAKSFIG